MNPKTRTPKIDTDRQSLDTPFPAKRVVFLDVIVRRFARGRRANAKLDRPSG